MSDSDTLSPTPWDCMSHGVCMLLTADIEDFVETSLATAV